MYSFSVNSRNHLLKARNTEVPFFFDKKKRFTYFARGEIDRSVKCSANYVHNCTYDKV